MFCLGSYKTVVQQYYQVEGVYIYIYIYKYIYIFFSASSQEHSMTCPDLLRCATALGSCTSRYLVCGQATHVCGTFLIERLFGAAIVHALGLLYKLLQPKGILRKPSRTNTIHALDFTTDGACFTNTELRPQPRDALTRACWSKLI